MFGQVLTQDNTQDLTRFQGLAQDKSCIYKVAVGKDREPCISWTQGQSRGQSRGHTKNLMDNLVVKRTIM